MLLGALNGLAGLMLLDDKPEEAITTFREGLAIGARFMCSLDGGNNPGAAAATKWLRQLHLLCHQRSWHSTRLCLLPLVEHVMRTAKITNIC